MGDFETVMKAIDEDLAKLRLTVNGAERQALLKRIHKLLAQADRIISGSSRAKSSQWSAK